MHELLVIEDHALLRAAMIFALRREGFVAYAAGGTVEALGLLTAHPAIAVALLEIELGADGPDGFAFAVAARAMRPDIAIIFLTGRADLLVGRPVGAREAHLVKPCPIDRVASTIRRMVP